MSDEESPGNPIFGDWGDVARARGAMRVAAPLGMACLRCEEAIVEGDVGEVMPSVDARGRVSPRPMHRECHLLCVVGHDYGVCSCTGFANAGSMREAALELWRRVQPS